MAATADLGVVGCGIFGLSAGAFAALRGQRVVAWDRSHVGAGASGRSGAIVRAFYATELLARGVVRCREELWKHLPEVLGVASPNPPAFVTTGQVKLASHHESFDSMLGWKVGIVELTPTEAAARFAWLRPLREGERAFWEEEAGYANTGCALALMRAAVEGRGGRILEDCPVLALDAEPGGSWRVRTAHGDWSVGAVLLAPGPWAAPVARLAGLDVPVRPRAVQVLILNRQGLLPEPMPAVVDLEEDFYSRPLAGGFTHVGYSSERNHPLLDSMDAFREDIRPELGADLRDRFARTVRPAHGALLLGHRAAAYEWTEDETFILGRTPRDGMYVAAGGSGHGYKFGPLIGREMAALVAGEKPPFVTDPMFAMGRPITKRRGMLGQ
jgi:sarcosine oxidase subunit beta